MTGRPHERLPAAVPLPATLQTLALRYRPLRFLSRCRRRFGGTFTIRLLDLPPLTVLCEPPDVAAVLGAPPAALHPGAGASTIAPIIGASSFIVADEEAHWSVRSAVAPAFARGVLAGHGATIARLAREEVASWPVGRPVALHGRLRSLAASVMIASVFGERSDGADTLRSELLAMLAVGESFLSQEPKLRHLPWWRGKWRRLERSRERVDRALCALIRAHSRRPQGPASPLDRLLALRRADGSGLAEREIADHLLALTIAGHETTASTLGWLLQFLAHDAGVQRRLVDEIDAGSGDDYLTATVLETLRHAPVFVFAIPRAVVEPVEIGGFGYRPPRLLAPCLYLMHHDPRLFVDPYAFRPERFLNQMPTGSGWAPWGGGRRRCLGRHLATLEIQTVLREVLLACTLAPARPAIEQPRWRAAILAPAGGARVTLRARQH